MSLRVLFVGMRWDYKDPTRGSSFEYMNLFQSMQQMDGVDAELFAFDELEQSLGRARMNQELLRRAGRDSYDLIFFFLYEREFDPATVKKLTSHTTTFNWFADDHWRFHTYSKHWAPHFSYIGTTDERALDLYASHRLQNVIATQWACNHHIYRPLDVPRDLDTSFVGQAHGDRPQIVNDLRAAGLEVGTWGSGWEAGRLEHDDMIRVFSRTKVNLNLGGASTPAGPVDAALFLFRPHGSLILHPGRIRDNARGLAAKRRPQIKGRNFEIPGCRGFLLTSEVAGLESFFRVGTEIETFSSQPELVEKCRYFLVHEDEREEMATAGYERVLKHHTYERRFRELFRVMGFEHKQLEHRRQRPTSAEESLRPLHE